MVDPLGTERIEGPCDVFRRALLARVGSGSKPGGAGEAICLGEQLGWVAGLRRIEADPKEPVALVG